MSDPILHEEDHDVIVVGYGMAGVTAALEAADAGARVLVLDRDYGGGATALSGGVVYAGGGTRTQRDGGVEDSPENMLAYLRQEVGDAVSEETMRRYCESGPETIDWLESQGAQFRGTVCPYKTSYPTDAHYLYYSGNELAWPYRNTADPAPRGHRQVAKGMESGGVLFERLRATAERKGVEFWPLTKVEDLLVEDARVVGVRYRRISPDSVGAAHRRLSGVGAKLTNWVPGVGRAIGRITDRAWEKAEPGVARAGAVVISGGGFMFNEELKLKHGPAYRQVAPLGTVGDDGGAIALGVGAGGATSHLHNMTLWRFMSPPSAMVGGIAVDAAGERIANEDLYGATHSHLMLHEHDGVGYLVLDSSIWRKARAQIRQQTQFFQRMQCYYIFSVGHVKSASLADLAARLGIPAAGLERSVREYNEGIRSGAGDPAHKGPSVSAPVEQGPFYAVDISVENSPAYPVAGLTLGGLRVDEHTGAVLDEQERSIPGLYAAGRSAVGLCSNSYVSGLSLGDAVFSGRRAGIDAASLRGAQAMQPGSP